MKKVTYNLKCRNCFGTGYFYQDDIDSDNYGRITKCERSSNRKKNSFNLWWAMS